MAKTTKKSKSTAKLKLPKDKKLTGLSAGLAKYYKTDPVLVRLGVVALIILTGVIPGLIIYTALYSLVKNSSNS